MRQGLPKVTGHHGLHSSLLSIVLPWMTPLLVGVGALAVTLLVAVPLVLRRNRGPKRLSARLALAGLATAVLAVLVAPTAWTVATIDSRYGGSAIAPAAGPMTRPGAGIPGAGGRAANAGEPPGGGQVPGARYARVGGQPPGGFGAGAQANAQAQQLVAWLRAHQPGSTYLLAVQGSSQAGEYILAGASVLPMGGFSGQVPFPTNDQLATLVADGQLRYVLLGGRGGPGGEGNSNFTAWVRNTCTVVSDAASGVSDLYDCAR